MTEQEVSTESNGQENIEKNESLDEETKIESEIIRQVEYYFASIKRTVCGKLYFLSNKHTIRSMYAKIALKFIAMRLREYGYNIGDLNLPRDRFLREQVKLDDGWIPLEIMLKFNRLAKLTTDADVLVKALKKSDSGLLEISEDNKKIRRSPEMPLPEMNEERRKELSSRTVYAKGFPKEETLDQILKYFKQFEEVENIIMRKYLEKKTKARVFKGSIFATFKTKEQAQNFMDSKETKYGETELIKRWQEEYLNEKQEEYIAKKEKRDKKDKKDKNSDLKEKEDKEEFTLPTGTLLHFTDGTDKMTREDVKSALTPLGAEVVYIDFKVGDKEGWVRLAKENQAKEVFEKITDGKLKIAESEVTFRLLEGEEEKTHLEKTISEMVKRRQGQKAFRGKSRGKGPSRKRKYDRNEGQPKKIKVE